MLPVSGAEQFVTSEPICPNRPMISAMTAYCNATSEPEFTDLAKDSADEKWREDTYLEVSQGHAVLGVMSLAQEEIPEAELARFRLEILNDRDDRLPPRCIVR
jgi:hypothetical protein